MTAVFSDLRSAVETTLAAAIGPRRIKRLQSRPSVERSSFAIDDIDVELDDGTQLTLVAKATSWKLLGSEASAAKPRFLHDAARELTTYQSILSTLDVGTTRYYGSVMCGPDDRRLLLERSAGVPLWQFEKSDAWHAAARWLARMHARASLAIDVSNGAGTHLLRYDELFYKCWMRRALAFQRGPWPMLARLAEGHRKVVEWLLRQPVGFIHGEFYSSNVLIERPGNGDFIVRPIDWEMSALGPPMVDLASLLSGRWTDEERREVVGTYMQTLEQNPHRLAVPESPLETLDYGLIHLAVQNLGWSERWTAPPQHAHDWLGEALSLCEKWNL